MIDTENTVSDADGYIDQLNVLCEEFGCEPGYDRLHWLHDELSQLRRLRSAHPASDEVVERACKIQHVGWSLWHEPQKNTARSVMRSALTAALSVKPQSGI